MSPEKREKKGMALLQRLLQGTLHNAQMYFALKATYRCKSSRMEAQVLLQRGKEGICMNGFPFQTSRRSSVPTWTNHLQRVNKLEQSNLHDHLLLTIFHSKHYPGY